MKWNTTNIIYLFLNVISNNTQLHTYVYMEARLLDLGLLRYAGNIRQVV